jgi:myo-inositol-1(or 4)-monophosphatase
MINKIIEISKEAGTIIKDGFGTNFEIEYKGSSSNLVTEIDKKSETLILNYISKEFPRHSVLSEENGKRMRDSEYIWVIDPLDGTTNFAHGLPIFSVSIAVMKNGETCCGAVYDVMRDVIYSAETNSGAFMNGKRIKVNSIENFEESVLVTGFPYDIQNNPFNAVQKFEAFLLKARAVRRLGSAALDFCYVASGVFSGFWEVKLSPWDFAAGDLIVREAGGIVTDLEGKNLTINSSQILATNGILHQKMLEILRKT